LQQRHLHAALLGAHADALRSRVELRLLRQRVLRQQGRRVRQRRRRLLRAGRRLVELLRHDEVLHRRLLRPLQLAPACAALAVALVAAAAPRPARAVIGGTPDAGDPAVVALEPAQCTGTLVASRVVLTAAHCLWGRDPAQLTAVFGADVHGRGRRIAVIDGRLAPDWSPTTQENDLALLLLAEPAAGVAPVPLLRSAIDDHLLGATLRLVGFGQDRRKESGTTRLVAYLATTIVDGGGPAMTCLGDSGGPALLALGGTEYLAAVTSRGDAACRLFAVRTRVDPYVAGFIQPYIDATQPGAARLGDPCAYPAQCATGLCRPADDDPARRFCSARCAGDGECPPAMTCVGGRCAHRPPSPGALGAPCDRDGDCAGWLCPAARAAARSRACRRPRGRVRQGSPASRPRGARASPCACRAPVEGRPLLAGDCRAAYIRSDARAAAMGERRAQRRRAGSGAVSRAHVRRARSADRDGLPGRGAAARGPQRPRAPARVPRSAAGEHAAHARAAPRALPPRAGAAVTAPADAFEAALAIARALDTAGIPYALGGALAYGQYGIPRATNDVDVNVFVPPE